MKTVVYFDVKEYAKNRIAREIDKYLQKLFCFDKRGRIAWCVFDKEEFDKKLKKDIKKKYVSDCDLDACWNDCLKAMPYVYLQQEFLLDSYGHKFKRFGKNRDYGAVIFYAINAETNPDSCKNLITKWFDSIVVGNYKYEKEKHNRLGIFAKEPFESYIRWRPIADAAMHFDKTLTLENIKKQIILLSKQECLSIKSIDDYTVVFE